MSEYSSRRHSPSTFSLGVWLLVTLLIFMGGAFVSSPQTEDQQAPLELHMIVAISVLLLLVVLRWLPKTPVSRLLFVFFASYLSFVYFYWRLTYTLEYKDPLSFTVACILFGAETYGFIILTLTNFVNLCPLNRRPYPLPEDRSVWPTVDVMVPSYNEGMDILKVTLLAALQMDYPKEKLNVYLLDDGGTDQRCNHSDPEIAARACQRRTELQEMCLHYGVHYLARERNVHAKAGNLNAGLQHSNGDLVLVLDADHIPTVDFLVNTVGWFLKDPKMFLVQTPHFFSNPDPIEKNLQTFTFMPSEGEMFYRATQKGLDYWNGSFFCGSAAVLRRRYLEEVGGFSGQSITEDAETALTLHAAGYNSAFIDYPMINGLAPESLSGFVQQRVRWATGMLQIFLLKNPLFVSGLKLAQRICYLSSCFFWFFPLARMIFLIAPVFFLFFGMEIYETDSVRFLIYAGPHIAAVFLLSNYLFGRLRWTFVSEIYEMVQSSHTLPAMFKTLLNPRAPVFKVTAKGEVLDRDSISPFAKPFYILFVVNVACVVMGMWNVFTQPNKIDPSVITMVWAILNCVLLFACLGVMIERRQRRTTPRIPADYPVTIEMAGHTMMGRFGDLSNTGAGIWISGTHIPRNMEWKQELTMTSKGDFQDREFHLAGVVRNFRELGDGMWVGVEFTPKNDQQLADQVVLVNGSSRRWRRFQLSREVQRGIISSFFFVLFYGLKFSLEHLGYLLLFRGRRDESQGKELSKEQKAKAFYDSSQKVYRVDSSGAETNPTLKG
jgi:cellulose synthase (UDP-forming)